MFWSINLDVQWEDRWKPPVVLICDPKHVWFSSVFIGYQNSCMWRILATFIGYQTYELLMNFRSKFINACIVEMKHIFEWLSLLPIISTEAFPGYKVWDLLQVKYFVFFFMCFTRSLTYIQCTQHVFTRYTWSQMKRKCALFFCTLNHQNITCRVVKMHQWLVISLASYM